MKKRPSDDPIIKEQIQRLARFTTNSNWLRAGYDTKETDDNSYDSQRFLKPNED